MREAADRAQIARELADVAVALASFYARVAWALGTVAFVRAPRRHA